MANIIGKWKILLLIFLFTFACGEEMSRQTIPMAQVYFRIDPMSYDDELKNPDSYKIFKEANRRFDTDRFGFAGVLVVTDAYGGLHAFDLCCPHEDKKLVVVSPEYDGHAYDGTVKCTSCGSVFITMFGLGSVESGPSVEYLQRYNVTPLSDGSYRITN